MGAHVPFEFDDNFASGWEWAALYRKLGWQVIPAHMPGDGPQWKRPLLATWAEFQDTLVSTTIFSRWYDPLTGDYRNHKNMGAITGSASDDGLWVADLDNKEGQKAEAWWAGLLALHNNNIEPETPTQRTGGGGRQLFFRAKAGWRPPTFKTSIGVDIRGQGGFAMLPPSAHASGQPYRWEPGRAPWEVEVLEAPDWLIEAVEQLREEHGGQDHAEREMSTTPEGVKNAFGLDVDGREDKIRAMVWGSVVDLYRESPIPPPRATVQAEIDRLWTHYEQTTKTRLTGPEFDTLDNAAKLEREGRGLSEFKRKYAAALKKWETRVRQDAAIPRPNPPPLRDPPKAEDPDGEAPHSTLEIPPFGIVTPFHGEPKSREWLVENWVVEGAVNSLYGGSGTGKSLLALQLAASVSLGVPWLGIPTKPGPVLMISCEDDKDELHRRLNDIKRAMGYALGWPFADLHIADRVGQENRLAVTDRSGNIAAGPFLAPLEQAIGEFKPSLLILDTLADVYAANEIDRGQVNYFLKTILTGLIRRASHTLTIKLLGHPSDSGKAPGGKGYSGSGAWEAGMRCRNYLAKPDDGGPNERILTRGKANYASAGVETGLRVTWTEGVFKADRELEDGDPVRALLMQAIRYQVRLAWDARAPFSVRGGHRRNVFAMLPLLLKEDFDPVAVRQVVRQMIEDGQLQNCRKSGLSGLSPE